VPGRGREEGLAVGDLEADLESGTSPPSQVEGRATRAATGPQHATGATGRPGPGSVIFAGVLPRDGCARRRRVNWFTTTYTTALVTTSFIRLVHLAGGSTNHTRTLRAA